MLHVTISYFNMVRPIKETLFVSNNFYRTTTMILFHSEKKRNPGKQTALPGLFHKKELLKPMQTLFLVLT